MKMVSILFLKLKYQVKKVKKKVQLLHMMLSLYMMDKLMKLLSI